MTRQISGRSRRSARPRQPFLWRIASSQPSEPEFAFEIVPYIDTALDAVASYEIESIFEIIVMGLGHLFAEPGL